MTRHQRTRRRRLENVMRRYRRWVASRRTRGYSHRPGLPARRDVPPCPLWRNGFRQGAWRYGRRVHFRNVRKYVRRTGLVDVFYSL